MDINEMLRSFNQEASKLGDYKAMTKTQLANGYCDADEALIIAKQEQDSKEIKQQQELKSAYFAALMVRYWFKIFEWASNSTSLCLDYTDFADWLSHSLYVAFYYRLWRYEYEAIVKEGKFIDWKRDEAGNLITNKYYYVIDDNAFDKIVNRCCASMRGRMYQFYNKDKRKADVQVSSIDELIDDAGDSAVEYLGFSEDHPDDGVKYLIDALVKKDKNIEALIVSSIAYGESFKQRKIQEENASYVANIFDPRSLVKYINMMDQNYIRKFCLSYSVHIDDPNILYTQLKSMNNSKLYRMIKKTLLEIKQTPELLSCIN